MNLFKGKAKQTKEKVKDISFDQLVIGGSCSGKTGSTFHILSTNGVKVASLSDSIEYMCELGAKLALENDDTGLSLSMIRLGLNESLTLDDGEFKEIKVTRIS